MKIRQPIAYKYEDKWLWAMVGNPPVWKKMYYDFTGSGKMSVINQKFGVDFMYEGKWFYKDYVNNGLKGHNGIDFYAVEGTTLFAVQDGIVGWINDPNDPATYNDGYGGWIEVDCNVMGERARFGYAHCSKILVKSGAQVYAGTPIALSGNTGKYTTGAHLHFAYAPLDDIMNKENPNNGYFGWEDPTMLFISYSDTAKKLTDIEKLYWYSISKGEPNIYTGLFGRYWWNKACKELGIDLDRDMFFGNYYDYSNSHK